MYTRCSEHVFDSLGPKQRFSLLNINRSALIPACKLGIHFYGLRQGTLEATNISRTFERSRSNSSRRWWLWQLRALATFVGSSNIFWLHASVRPLSAHISQSWIPLRLQQHSRSTEVQHQWMENLKYSGCVFGGRPSCHVSSSHGENVLALDTPSAS